MENTKILIDNLETAVNGVFYVFNSKYYFIYTLGELDEKDYVKLYVVQVCKEIQNTPTGPIDTGYMLGMEITNTEEWSKVQESITKVVQDKKTGMQSPEIQYMSMSMLVNLKIVSKNNFKLMRHIVEENFKVLIQQPQMPIQQLEPIIDESALQPQQPVQVNQSDNSNENLTNVVQPIPQNVNTAPLGGEVIIDYRAKFFEEQDKNQELEEQIKVLTEKLNNIKDIIG